MQRVSRMNMTIAALLVITAVSAAQAADVRDIELRRLFEPTPSERATEQQGRIYIYDGLNRDDISRAMTEEFDRVESMMFIRVRPGEKEQKAVEKGDEPAPRYDDGC